MSQTAFSNWDSSGLSGPNTHKSVCRPRSHLNLKLACRGGMFSQERSFDEVRILLQIKIIYTDDSLTLGLRYPVTLLKCPEVLLQFLLVRGRQ